MSLRTGTVYTVNIFDDAYSGAGVTLKGAAEPFVTEENDDDDIFMPVRTQSGYLRIVDDGKDDSGNALSSSDGIDNIYPQTDTSRPVVLTKPSGSGTAILWRGFLQAENFGNILYGGTQVKSFPLQCVLSAMSSKYVDTTNRELHNFAWHIKKCFNSVGVTGASGYMTYVYYHFQGGAYARQWLLKEVDPQNFVTDNGNGEIAAKYDELTVLEDICKYWGWTVRTQGNHVYFMFADSTDDDILTLNPEGMNALANRTNTSAGSIGSYGEQAITGNVFATFNNELSHVRGFSRALVTADGNSGNEAVIDLYPEGVVKKMKTMGLDTEAYDNSFVNFTNDLLSFPANDAPSPFLAGSAVSGYGAFCLASATRSHETLLELSPVIRIKKSYNGNSFASLSTTFQHAFYDPGAASLYFNRGGIMLNGYVFYNGEKYIDVDGNWNVGRKTMRMKLGIGASRATALWWNGNAWGSTETSFMATIGNDDDYFRSKYVSGNNQTYRKYIPTDNTALKGLIFVDFLGSQDLDEISGERKFFIVNFQLQFVHNDIEMGQSGISRVVSERELSDRREYMATNDSMVISEWAADCVYASDNEMEFGYGVVINPDGSLMEKATYADGDEYPEQHLADRVADYFATSKKKVYAELRADAISDISPADEVTIGGVTGTAISISREWHDDIVRLTVMEV